MKEWKSESMKEGKRCDLRTLRLNATSLQDCSALDPRSARLSKHRSRLCCEANEPEASQRPDDIRYLLLRLLLWSSFLLIVASHIINIIISIGISHRSIAPSITATALVC